jgi:glycine oxidase
MPPGPTRAASEVAVVGAGVIGLTIAWRLAQRGYNVTVFEQGEAGTEASWAGAGMLAPGGEIHEDSVLTELALESLRLYPSFVIELERVSGSTIDFQRCGALDLAYSADEAFALERRAELQQQLGIRSRPVKPSDVKAFWPRVNLQELESARFYAEDAVVNPREVLACLKSACAKTSVAVRTKSPVLGVDVLDDEVQIRAGETEGSFGSLVIAAGAWSSSIPVAGVPPLPASKPIKGHLIGYHQPAQTCTTILRHGHTYLFQRASGLLVAGASVEDVGYDRTLQPSIADQLSAEATFILPHLGETTFTEVWSGFRPAAESIQLGRWHSRALYLAYGPYRNGILLAPVTAERIVNEISASSEMPPDATAAHRQ